MKNILPHRDTWTKNRSMRPSFLGAICLFLLCFQSKTFGAFGFKVDGTLDKEAISHAYFEGEFSKVLPPLEMFRQSYPNPTRDDQIFVYKYLSVIYAADSSTRQKAESYMVQLVKLMPTIELIDLYISDNIQAIFKNVKSNFLNQQSYVRDHDIYGHPKEPGLGTIQSDSTESAIRKPKKSWAWIWWTVGGVGLTAATVTAMALNESDSKSTTHQTDIIP